jgi:hypothetical protein
MQRLADNDSTRLERAMLAGVLWLVLGCCACGGGLAPVLNIEGAPIASSNGVPLTRAFVRDAIVRALVSRGWQIEQDRPEGITATTVSGTNTATIQIEYDERAYSIHHVSSSPSLRYDGSAIHRKYNQWIERLRVAVRAQLAIPMPPGSAAPPAAAATAPPASPPPATPNEYGEMPPAPPPPPPPGL